MRIVGYCRFWAVSAAHSFACADSMGVLRAKSIASF